MKRLGVLLSLALLLGLLVAPISAQPKEVVIGVIYPMSGPAAQAGVDNKAVFELAADIADRKSTRLNSSHIQKSRMPSSA